MSKISHLLVGFIKITGMIPALIFLKPKVYKLNKNTKRFLPKNSILMSNHTSLLDFVLYLIIFWNKSIHFLMAEVLFNKGKLFSWFLYKIGGIFVNRDACDFTFVEDSIDVLDNNGIVGVFPQGRLPVGGKPFPYKPGIVLIALKTNSPIIPVYTDGNYGLFKRAHVIIGDPIYISDYTNNENASDEELKKLAEILQEKNFALKDELEKRMNKNYAK